MLQGVLHQLLSQIPELLPFVYNIYEDLVKSQRISKPEWTFDALCAAWKAITQQRTVRLYTCMLLDALDEHEGDNNRLSKFIYELLSGADGIIVRIKICVASRNWNIFGEHFGSCPQFAIHEHTTSDIQAYTSERLSGAMASFGEEGRLAFLPKIERLASHVTTKARGVFIWVRIVVDELVKGIRDGTPISLLEEKVTQMPEELSDLYRHTLERIESEYAEESYIMLQITLCSLSPLPLDMFMGCVSLSRWQEVHEATEAEMMRQLISRSGGLLEILSTAPPLGTETSSNESGSEDGQVSDSTWSMERRPYVETTYIQFIHQTVKDFVAANRSNLGLLLGPSFKAESGYLYLLESGMAEHAWDWAWELRKAIFEYAFLAETEGATDVVRLYEAFFPRLKSIRRPGRTQLSQVPIQRWINTEHPYAPQLGIGYLGDSSVEEQMDNLLVLTAAADLKNLVTYQIEQLRATGWPTELLTVVATGKRLSTSSASRESMISLLLKPGNIVDSTCVALDIKDRRTLLNSEGGTVYRTALAWVLRHEPQKDISSEERYSIARLLLENRANPNALAVPDRCCPDGTPLLQSCIRHYDVEAVRLLLLNEADTDYLDEPVANFQLALAEAVSGEMTISELLREYGLVTLYHRGTLPSIAYLIVNSWSLVATGSPRGGRIIGALFGPDGLMDREQSATISL
jgi:hypothetical protein